MREIGFEMVEALGEDPNDCFVKPGFDGDDCLNVPPALSEERFTVDGDRFAAENAFACVCTSALAF